MNRPIVLAEYTEAATKDGLASTAAFEERKSRFKHDGAKPHLNHPSSRPAS